MHSPSFGFGRLPALDERDYPMAQLLGIPQAAPPEGLATPCPGDYYWQVVPPYQNQGARPICVGAAWSHWLASPPVRTRDGPDPEMIYHEAQLIDEWPGEAYEGTSVRAGAKYLRATGRIASYFWAASLQEILEFVKTRGPVVIGSNWHSGMMTPLPNGLVTVSGPILGGHAYLLYGVSEGAKLYRLLNSWGDWGQGGGFWLTFADFERLFKENGEAVAAVEQRVGEVVLSPAPITFTL